MEFDIGVLFGGVTAIVITFFLANGIFNFMPKLNIIGKLFGRKKDMARVVSGVVVAAFVFGFIAVPTVLDDLFGESQTASVVGTGSVVGTAYASCPSDGDSIVTLTTQNTANTSGVETFETTWTMLGSAGSRITGTTSTDDDHTVNCGETYELIVESADGQSGDNSEIQSVIIGVGAKVNSEGNVVFTPTKSAYTLTVGVPQHATIEFKAYDNNNAGWMYDSGDADATAFEADAVTYKSTTDNTTAYALSADGDFLDVTLSVRADQVDTEFCDNYCLVAVEAPVTEYDEPTMTWNGRNLVNVKGTLNVNEEKQLSGYEYIYKLDSDIKRTINNLGFYIEANADASTDLQVDFLAAGKVDSINGVDLLTSTAQDNSGASTVYAIQDVTFDIS